MRIPPEDERAGLKKKINLGWAGKPLVHAAVSGDGTFGIVRWDERFVADAEDQAGQATCEGGEHLPLIGVLGATPSDNIKRASVVRSVAENAILQQREFNKAFVLMQYFGYLQRNPDDPPDTDISGYNFWLGKLNQFNGDFVNAEMVKAFISAGEYRQRFGQN